MVMPPHANAPHTVPAIHQPRRQLISRSLWLGAAALLGTGGSRTVRAADGSAPTGNAARTNPSASAQAPGAHAHDAGQPGGNGATPAASHGAGSHAHDTHLAPAPATGQGSAPAGAQPAIGEKPAKADAPVLLVLGDSLSAGYGLARGEGWVSLLEKRMQEGASKARKGWQVVNASISGETTAGGRSRLAELLGRHKPALVIIELGGNDALRGLPLKAATDNLREMLRTAQAAGAKTMLVGMQMPPNYGPAYARQFEQMYQRLATETDSALVPFLLAGFGDDPAWFQADGIHPNAAAQTKMLDNVWSVLEGLLVEARLKFLSRQAIC